MQMRSSHVNSGPPGVQLLISNEGIIGLLHAGTARERVVSLAGVADIDWQVIIDMPNCGICGAATPMTEQVLKFYEQLVFEARRSHGREPNLTP